MAAEGEDYAVYPEGSPQYDAAYGNGYHGAPAAIMMRSVNNAAYGEPAPPPYNPVVSPYSAAYPPDPEREEALRVHRVHGELQRLDEDEKGLLDNVQSEVERNEIKEQYFHQRMNLLQQLPLAERNKYQMRTIQRMGTVRDNLNGEDDTSYRPLFCILIFIVNVAVFLAAMDKNDWHFESTRVNPLYGPSAAVLDAMGAKNGPKIHDGDWWRLLVPMFLHAGVIHLVMNMLVLMRLGASMEQGLGHWRVGFIYLVSGYGGNLASAIFLPNVETVGASGALFGLIGALFGDFIQNHHAMRSGKWGYFFSLLFSTIIGLAIGLCPLLDNFAHVGGWLTGLLLGTALLAGTMKDRRGRRILKCYTVPLALFCFIAISAILVVGTIVLFSSVNPGGWCSWCHNISCVETSWWDCDDEKRTS